MVIIQNKVEPCIICGKVVSRSSDIPRHMRKHDSSAKFVVLFFNSLLIIYVAFIGNSLALGMAVTSVLSRSPTWTLIIADSVYHSFSIFPPH